MGVWANALSLLALVLFVAVVYVQTLRNPPGPDVRAGWPLRQFWVGAGLRHAALVFAGLSAVLGVASMVGNGVWGDGFGSRPVLLAAAAGLAVLGGAALAYSVALYWQPPRPKPARF